MTLTLMTLIKAVDGSPLAQAEFEDMTGQLDFDYSEVNIVKCSPQLHNKRRSCIANAWDILSEDYQSFGTNRMNVVEPDETKIQPVDPHQVWWAAFGNTEPSVTIPV